MGLTFSGKTPSAITIGGKQVDNIVMNGEIVWPEQVIQPSITVKYTYFAGTSNSRVDGMYSIAGWTFHNPTELPSKYIDEYGSVPDYVNANYPNYPQSWFSYCDSSYYYTNNPTEEVCLYLYASCDRVSSTSYTYTYTYASFDIVNPDNKRIRIQRRGNPTPYSYGLIRYVRTEYSLYDDQGNLLDNVATDYSTSNPTEFVTINPDVNGTKIAEIRIRITHRCQSGVRTINRLGVKFVD